jgi:hypothetical protein
VGSITTHHWHFRPSECHKTPRAGSVSSGRAPARSGTCHICMQNKMRQSIAYYFLFISFDSASSVLRLHKQQCFLCVYTLVSSIHPFRLTISITKYSVISAPERWNIFIFVPPTMKHFHNFSNGTIPPRIPRIWAQPLETVEYENPVIHMHNTSTAEATLSKLASPHGRPISCKPIGRPCLSWPTWEQKNQDIKELLSYLSYILL